MCIRDRFYGDYDVDGTTAVALMYSFFRKRYSKIGYYIPDRYNEGYGISFKGIDFAFENGYSLIIALDCGINVSYTHLRAHETPEPLVCRLMLEKKKQGSTV